MGVLIHILGDAVNNVGVIISASVIWLTHYDARYYADPAVGMGIAFMILISSISLSMYTKLKYYRSSTCASVDELYSASFRSHPPRKRSDGR